jgi:hypothetical protein
MSVVTPLLTSMSTITTFIHIWMIMHSSILNNYSVTNSDVTNHHSSFHPYQ